jgi:hypothetical protein
MLWYLKMSRFTRHFVITVENGRLLVSRAKEVIPNRTYEIIDIPTSFLDCLWPVNHSVREPPFRVAYQDVGLGEKVEKLR